MLIHRTNEHDTDATPPDGTRVITEESLERLKLAVLSFARAVADSAGSWGNPEEVTLQLTENRLIAGEIFSRFGVAPRPRSR